MTQYFNNYRDHNLNVLKRHTLKSFDYSAKLKKQTQQPINKKHYNSSLLSLNLKLVRFGEYFWYQNQKL